MADLLQRVSQASAHVEPAWSAERAARIRAGVGRGLERQRRQRVAAVVALGACTLALGYALGRHTLPPVARTATDSVAAPLLQLPDGSTVSAGSRDARVETVAVGPEGVTLRLEAGTARFSVTPNPRRPFRVLARDVNVSVLGTVFTVALEAKDVRVGVERGRVRVDAPRESRVLELGESRSFESASAPMPAARAADSAAPVAAAEADDGVEMLPQAFDSLPLPEATPRASAPAPSWRALAKDQNYGAALARLAAEGPNAVRDTPEDLLLAADVARLGGHPERAVAPLQRVIADHAFDPRAPLAAFTLGRTLLEQLGRPRDAAQAFATARRLDRGGTLRQDALAREVESWAGAGEAEHARARALEYVKQYPDGRRLAAVRRLGGLD